MNISQSLIDTFSHLRHPRHPWCVCTNKDEISISVLSGFKKTFVGFITNVIAYAGVSWAATGLGKTIIIYQYQARIC